MYYKILKETYKFTYTKEDCDVSERVVESIEVEHNENNGKIWLIGIDQRYNKERTFKLWCISNMYNVTTKKTIRSAVDYFKKKLNLEKEILDDINPMRIKVSYDFSSLLKPDNDSTDFEIKSKIENNDFSININPSNNKN